MKIKKKMVRNQDLSMLIKKHGKNNFTRVAFTFIFILFGQGEEINGNSK